MRTVIAYNDEIKNLMTDKNHPLNKFIGSNTILGDLKDIDPLQEPMSVILYKKDKSININLSIAGIVNNATLSIWDILSRDTSVSIREDAVKAFVNTITMESDPTKFMDSLKYIVLASFSELKQLVLELSGDYYDNMLRAHTHGMKVMESLSNPDNNKKHFGLSKADYPKALNVYKELKAYIDNLPKGYLVIITKSVPRPNTGKNYELFSPEL